MALVQWLAGEDSTADHPAAPTMIEGRMPGVELMRDLARLQRLLGRPHRTYRKFGAPTAAAWQRRRSFLASLGSDFVTGQSVVVDGGNTTL
jgi:hypothetical protein